MFIPAFMLVQSADAVSSSRDRLRHLQRQLDDTTRRIAELSADVASRERTIAELHPWQARVTEMEQRLRTMADHLLQKVCTMQYEC